MSLKKISLPLVEAVCSYFPKRELSQVRIIGSQNLLPTTFRMFLSLFARGLNPANVTLIGKCYSTSPDVVAEFKKLGCDIAFPSTIFEPEKPYDLALEGYLDEYFQQKICTEDFSSYEKIIVMDDGGEFLKKMQDLMSFVSHNFVGIEQTSSGYHKLKDKPLRFPIINVGRSEVKLKYEAPLIAWTLIRKIKQSIAQLSIQPHSVAVIGSGPIGNAVYSFLEQMKRFSISHIRSSQEVDICSGLSSFDMIIGCTGKTLFKPQDFHRLKQGVILASASYSDTEFNASFLRQKSTNISSCHQDINIDGITLLNCGFPVNFDENYETVDPELFQLTRSLLATAIFQSLEISCNDNKLIDLNSSIQQKIAEFLLNDPVFQEILSFNLECSASKLG